jgi:hypothetical protein
MSYTYRPVEEKDDRSSSDEESQDMETLLPAEKPSLISYRPHVFWLSLHLLLTLGLLIGLRLQSRQSEIQTCPKLFPLELRKIFPKLVSLIDH